MSPKRVRWMTTARILVDAILINVGFFLAYWVRYELQWFLPVYQAFWVPYSVYFSNALALTVILLLVHWAEGVYDSKQPRAWLIDVFVISRAVVTSVAALYVLSLTRRPVLYSRLIFGYAGLAIVVLLAAARALESFLEGQLRKLGYGEQRVLSDVPIPMWNTKRAISRWSKS